MQTLPPISCVLSLGLALLLLGCSHEKSLSSVSSSDETQCHTHALTLSSTAVDFVFPNGLSTYGDGTVVLQPKNGRIYRCKGFPYSGFCQQWSSASTRFEPGTGSNWMAAWDLQ
ncbi:MAG TPA: hypothetical protein VE954_14060 [Oligoflexus sp.]|nr:hypothetical protein [Oligoflexus sp.]HYX34224.1 hypothetical protein [Oligoflexus sp.]